MAKIRDRKEYFKIYLQSPIVKQKRREAAKRYSHTLWGIEKIKSYRQSPEGIRKNELYLQSPEFKKSHKEAMKRYYNSPKGIATRRCYKQSLTGKLAVKRYKQSSGGKLHAIVDGFNRRLKTKDLTVEKIQMVYEDNIKKYGTLTCYLCKLPISFGKDNLEHKIPLCRGGNNDYNNLSVACQSCNCKKHHRTEEEYRKCLSG